MKSALPLLIFPFLILSGCKNNADEADAYGNFEATEIIISSETNGRILMYDPEEGMEVAKDEIIALIDTTMLHLQKGELSANKKSILTRLNSVNAQNEILDQQISNLNINITRIENMLKNDAATEKQYDDLTGQVSVLQKQIEANNTQKSSINAELEVLASKEALIDEQISRSIIRSPRKATLLEKYAEAGEVTTPGKPIAKIADLSVMKLKVYVSGAQLSSIKTGQQCTIRIDHGEKAFSSFPGVITNISGKAEFTPKIIQTKEERVTLVYAVTINVSNDGSMKAGMPGEAIF